MQRVTAMGLNIQIEGGVHVHHHRLDAQAGCLIQGLEEGPNGLAAAPFAYPQQPGSAGVPRPPWRSGAPCAGQTRPCPEVDPKNWTAR